MNPQDSAQPSWVPGDMGKQRRKKEMTDYVYRLKQPTIAIKITGGATTTVAVSISGTVTTTFDVFSLRGAESVLRQAKWVENVTIRVNLQYSKFDESILSELFGTTSAGKDFEEGVKADYVHIYIDGDTYDHPDFEVRATLQSEDGTKEMGIRVPGVMFEDINWAIVGAGAVQPSLSGEGDNIHLHVPST